MPVSRLKAVVGVGPNLSGLINSFALLFDQALDETFLQFPSKS